MADQKEEKKTTDPAKEPVKYKEYARAFTETKVALYMEDDIVFSYNKNRYARYTDTKLKHEIRRFLIKSNRCHSSSFVAEICSTMKSILDELSTDKKMPFYHGREKANIIAYNNCLVDLDNETIMPHSKHWISENVLPFDYDPKAVCPEWEKFLNEVFDSDPECIALLQEWFGLCLTHDTSYQKMLLKVGLPRSGKGTIDRILQALLGEENYTSYHMFALGDKFGVEPLVGKQVAFIGEVNLSGNKDKNRIVETLKSIVGEDKQLVERKYNDCYTAKLTTRFSISCNQMPQLGDITGALLARMLILPFYNSFAGREDIHLEQKLLKEISGINNWALEGLKRLRKNDNFTFVSCSEDLISEFRRNTSPITSFISDYLIVDKKTHNSTLSNVEISPTPVELSGIDLMKAFDDWRLANPDIYHKSFPSFVSDLRSVLPKVVRDRRGKDRISYYSGICLKKI